MTERGSEDVALTDVPRPDAIVCGSVAVTRDGEPMTRAIVAYNCLAADGATKPSAKRVPTPHSRSIAATWSRVRMRAYIFIALLRL
jgi:hypothetical protein